MVLRSCIKKNNSVSDVSLCSSVDFRHDSMDSNEDSDGGPTDGKYRLFAPAKKGSRLSACIVHGESPSRRYSFKSRPGTAASVIEKLHIEKEDGGGLTISGIFVAQNCNIILLIMAGFFMLVGTILTAISYRPRDPEEDMDKYQEREQWSAQTRIVGPVFLLIGFIMLLLGLTLCLIGWKMTKEEREQSYMCNSRAAQGNFHRDSDFPQAVNLMPTISKALPFGVMSNPAFPVLFRYDDPQRRRALSLAPTTPRRSPVDSAVFTDPVGGSGGARRSSLPILEQRSAVHHQRGSSSGYRPTGWNASRRESVKHAFLISEAKNELREQEKVERTPLPIFLPSLPRSAEILHQQLSYDGHSPVSPLGDSYHHYHQYFSSPERDRYKDIACFPPPPPEEVRRTSLTSHGDPNPIEGESLPVIQVTQSSPRLLKKVTFAESDQPDQSSCVINMDEKNDQES